MRTPKASNAILEYAATRKQFVPADVENCCNGSRSTANNMCGRLLRDKKLALVKPAKIGRRGAPPVYALATTYKRTPEVSKKS